MTQLDDQTKQFIRLLLRSNDIGDGWRRVATFVEPIARMVFGKAPELFAIKSDDDGMLIRLTKRGKVVADYV